MTNNDVHNILREKFSEIDLSFFYADDPNVIYAYDEVSQYDQSENPYGYWYEMKFLGDFVTPEALGTSAKNRWKGIMQVNICVEKNIKTKVQQRDFSSESTKKRNYDTKVQTEVANKGVSFIFDNAYAGITDVMKRGLYINGVRIIKVYNSSVIDNDDYYTMPVSIEWQAHLDN